MKRCLNCMEEFEAEDWVCPKCGYTPPLVMGFQAHAPALSVEGGGFNPNAFSDLAKLEAGNFWFRARNKLIIWAMKRCFPNVDRYLEIGCGTGFVLSAVRDAYPDIRATGSEVFSVGLQHAAPRVAGVELVQLDARKIPYTDEFDVVGAFDVIEHIEEDEAVLSELFRSVKQGGGIAITVPQHPSLWSYQDESACHVRRYRVSELREKVERAGFKIQLETSFVSLLLPAMFMSRIFRKEAPKDGDGLNELRLPSLVNWAFEAVMGVERALIRAGIRFPLGGSLLLLAKKSNLRE